MSSDNFRRVSLYKLYERLYNLGFVCEGLYTAGSRVSISGPVTDLNRSMWEYLEKGLLYKSHWRFCEEPWVLVENDPLFTNLGSEVIWTDESQIDLDVCYKVKLTLVRNEHVLVDKPLPVPSAEVLYRRLWELPTDNLRKRCACLKLKTTGKKSELVHRIAMATN